VKGRLGNILCEMCGNLNFVSRQENTKKWKQLPKVPEAQVHGWVHTWQIEISNTTFLLSRNFLPLFLETGWIWIWDLRDIYSSNILNDGGFWWKGAMENFYVKCVEIWTLSQGRIKQKMKTTTKSAWSTCVWLGSHTWQRPGHYMPSKSNQISK